LTPDEVERIRAQAVEQGKAEYVLTTEVTDENGTVVASTTGTYQVRKM
jgi:acyl-coenzyme A thioesterase PaaI-like protein